MASALWQYWQIVISLWGWCLKQSKILWNLGKDAERDISTKMIDQTLAPDVSQISRSSSLSTGSTSVPNVCVTDFDDEAEPYWQIMGELSDGCSNEDGSLGGSDLEGEGKQVLVGICAMAKKSQSKPMKEILTRLEEFEYIKIIVFPEDVILKEPVEDWPIVDCLISFHSKGFPLDKAIHYANLRNPFIINNLPMQYDIQDRRRVYAILDSEGIEIPRYAVLDRDSADPKHHELVESEDHVEVNGVTFNKPFVEKPVSAEDHNIYIYYPTSAGGGSQRLFRKIGSRSSVYSPESRVRKTGSYIYEDFMPTDGTDVKVYTVGPDYAHAEARKSPALDGKVERDSEGKEIRYPVILSNAEKLISRKVCLAFKQTVCGFDLLRANGKSFVCDVNGFSFVKNSNKYYDDCAKILGNMILRELAPTLHIPWSVPFQLDDPPIVPTTFGKMMELRCVVAVIRHGDRTPKQKMKVEVRHPKFFEIFAKYDGYKHGHVKLKRPKQLQEILDTARSLLTEIQHRAAGPELEEKQGKLEQLKSVLEMYGHFSGINRKVQMKYQPRGRPRGSSSDDGNSHNRLGEPSLVLILKWGGELTPAGRIQAEELGRIFRCMYPGGQGRHLSEEDSEMLPSHGEYAGAQGLGLLRLHSTFRHDLKIYASDEGRVQMTAAAFAKGLLALEGELTPILVQMVKSANTNGLLDNDCDSSKYQNMVKTRLHELLQQDREFTREDREQINPGNALSINDALDFVKNPVKCCQHVQVLIQKLMDIVRIKKDDPKTKDAILYHGETWELMGRRWGKIEKDFCTKNKRFDISKIPDIYDCIKYDLQHNNHTLQFDHAEELYIYAKYLADIVIPQEYGLTVQEKLTIGQGICTPLLKKIRADLQRNIEESGEETVNRLNPRYSHGVSSPGRHVRTRLYFTSESHVHSLLTVLRYGGLLDVVTDEQWRRAMEYVSMVSELNYMSQIVVMLYEDPTKDPSSEERFHVELHFSPGVNCCVQKNLPPGPGFRPHSRNESSHNLETTSQCSTRIEEEDAELGVMDDDVTISPQHQSDSSPPLIETEEAADSTLDSPTTSRAIDMMDLDPNMMDEPYDSGFLQGSAPIPISARTVAGHEAARLGSQLAASQRQRREREASSICEPRARSYDHQRQEKPEKTADKLQYQSLDAVNKEADRSPRNFHLDDLFYETVDSLSRGRDNSSRNAGQKKSLQTRSISPSGLSSYASSPDLTDSDRASPAKLAPLRSRQQPYGTSQNHSPPGERPTARGTTADLENPSKPSKEIATNDDDDFWDFGESQLLEESPRKNQIPIARPKFEALKKTRQGQTQFPVDRSDPAPDSPTPNPKTNVPAQDLAETSSTKNPRSEFEDPETTSSPKTSLPIDFQKSRAIPVATSSPKTRNPVITRSPSYLGIPVSLPHSVSSPELPAPLIETILRGSGPLITLRNESLTSSTFPRPRRPSDSSPRAEGIAISPCVKRLPAAKSRHSMSIGLRTCETKRYGRSKSALTLSTINDPRGEFGLPVPKNTSTTYGFPNSRVTIHTQDRSFDLRRFFEAKSMNRHRCDAKMTKLGSQESVASKTTLESLSRSNGSKETSPIALGNRSGTEVELEKDWLVPVDRSTDLGAEVESLKRPGYFCRHCETFILVGEEGRDLEMERDSIRRSLSQPNSRRASLNVPRPWDVRVNRPEAVFAQSLPDSDYFYDVPSSSSQILTAGKSLSNLDGLRTSFCQPGGRRTSLNVPQSLNLRSISSEAVLIASSPVSYHSYELPTSSSQIPPTRKSFSNLDSLRTPLTQPDCRRASLNVPQSLDLTSIPPEPVLIPSSPVSNHSHEFPTSSSEIPLTSKSFSNLDSLRTPLTQSNSRRASSPLPNHSFPQIPATINSSSNPDSFPVSKSPPSRNSDQFDCEYSTSVPTSSHKTPKVGRYRRSYSTTEVPPPRISETYLEPSTTSQYIPFVKPNRDRDVFTQNEDFLQRQGHAFAGRSRSLSPCPQRCLCYNCNVAVLIQQSVNLSPAERSNFQKYFVQSLSHKFSNCTCYKKSLKSAEASRRVSRSASPNSGNFLDLVAFKDSGVALETSFTGFDARFDSKFEDDPSLRSFGDNSGELGLNCRQRREMERARRLERRQSSPQNIGSSGSSRVPGRLPSDVESPSTGSLMAGTSVSSRIQDLDSPEIIGRSNGAGLFDSFGPSVEKSGRVKGRFTIARSSEDPRIGHLVLDRVDNPDEVVESIDVDSINREMDLNADRRDRSRCQAPPRSGMVRSNNVGQGDVAQGLINDEAIQDVVKTSCPSLSRQMPCPEVVIDASNACPTSNPCQCMICTRGPSEDVPNLTKQYPRLRLNPPALVTPPMDSVQSERASEDRNSGRSLPRQFSCPEIIGDLPDLSISRQRNDLEASKRSISGYQSLRTEFLCPASSSVQGFSKKLKFSPDRKFSCSADKTDSDNVNIFPSKKSSNQSSKKIKKTLPRQFSCPEIIETFDPSLAHSPSHRPDRKSTMSPRFGEQSSTKFQNPPHSNHNFRSQPDFQSTANDSSNTAGPHPKNAISHCRHFDRDALQNGGRNLFSFVNARTHDGKICRIILSNSNEEFCINQTYESSASSRSSNPRLQTQRSFSSPDTRPSIIQEPDPTCTARRHRHSISGQMSYFKLLGYNVSKKLTGSANSLFSTAVISGSSSAPNLKDMVPSHASVVAAIEGFGGVPPIRPLETLHNALSLRQLDSFLDMMTSAPLFRTPASSPPKFPSPGGSVHGGSVVPNRNIGGIGRDYNSSDLEAVRYRDQFNILPVYITPTPIHYKVGQDGEGNDIRNQLSPTSPNSTGWSSEPQSFLSSEPSSPAPTSAGECSMSMSLVSNDGTQPFAGPKFSTTPRLDLDFNDFCMSMDRGEDARGESRGSISYTDYYSNEDGLIRKSGPDLAHLREQAAARDDNAGESIVDEDEEHTLTLRQTEEQRKQDVKFIFEQTKEGSSNLVKPSSSFKKIGRFRVESMEIADEDVRIKDAAAAAAATAAAAAAAAAAISSSIANITQDQTKILTASINEKFVVESFSQDSKKSKTGFSTPQPRSRHGSKSIMRSQSVSTPQNVCQKSEIDYESSQTAANKTGSFSTMSCKDLENWKAKASSPQDSNVVVSTSEEIRDEPILTLASSLKGNSNVTIGFNVQRDKKD